MRKKTFQDYCTAFLIILFIAAVLIVLFKEETPAQSNTDNTYSAMILPLGEKLPDGYETLLYYIPLEATVIGPPDHIDPLIKPYKVGFPHESSYTYEKAPLDTVTYDIIPEKPYSYVPQNLINYPESLNEAVDRAEIVKLTPDPLPVWSRPAFKGIAWLNSSGATVEDVPYLGIGELEKLNFTVNGPTVFQLRLKEASDASPFSHVQLHVLRSSGESRLDDLAYNHLNQHKYRVVGSKSVYNIYVFWRGLPNVVYKEATPAAAAALLSEKEILDWHDLD